MNTEEHIRLIEEKWLSILIPYIKEIFKDIWLPSHDHTHSIRTWNFAKELIILANNNHFQINHDAIEKILFAVFFHDTGMSKSLEIHHGKISKLICEGFIRENSKLKPSGINEILEAIEFHDDKSYKREVFTKDSNLFNTLGILSIADDLDSFGPYGIFRFWEINILRNYPIEQIPQKVLASLKSRVSNLISNFSFCPQFLDHQKARYQITRNFYLHLEINLQSRNNSDNLHNLEIVKLFNELIIQGKNSPDKILPLIQAARIDSKVYNFFEGFTKDYSHLNSS